MFEVELTGFDELEKKLLKLERKTSKKIVRKAIRNAARILLKEMKSNAKTMVGGNMGKLIARHLKTRAVKKQRRGEFALNVGTDPKQNELFIDITKKGKRNFIPSAIEFGHGNAKPIPFMTSAWDKKKKSVLQKLLKNIRDLLLEEAAKP